MTITENKKIFLILFTFFLIFYTVQIPFYTSNSDIIVFATRAMEKKPIFDYAFLNSSTLLKGNTLPNYHLGHTLVLWLVYKIMPEGLFSTIWPAGLVSAISGALITSLTFLIWRNLNINRNIAITIAIVVGFVPSIWEKSIIGEVYILQLLFILLFLYAFIRDKIFFSAIAFLFANLVSPLSALSFGLLLLKPISNRTLRNSVMVGSISLILYLGIYSLIGSNLLELLNPLSTEQEGRGFIYRSGMLITFLILNFNFFLFYLVKGIKLSYKDENKKTILLAIANIPQLLLLFLGSTFFIELGSFQLPIFWSLSFSLGLYISQIDLKKKSFIFASLSLLTFTSFVWILPNSSIGYAREETGKWLKNNGYKESYLIGPWNTCVGIITGKNDYSLKALNKYYFDEPYPSNEDILETKKKKIIIVQQKENLLRIFLAKLNFPGMELNTYDPRKEIKNGKISELFENDTVLLYNWEL